MTVTVVLATIGVLVIAAALWVLWQGRRRRALRERFGPEYDRTVRAVGSTSKAEAELLERAKRLEQFHVRELSHDDRDRFADLWRRVQAIFVDDPPRAVADGDRLIGEVMRARGYPVDDDFEHRARDLSVHHATVVQHYRAGRELALQRQRGAAGTEELRQAMLHYHSLFDELLNGRGAHHDHARRAS